MRLIALLFVVSPSLIFSQVVATPYNPDANGDSFISAPDLLNFLPVFGAPFTPNETTVDGTPLSETLSQLESTIDSLTAISSIPFGESAAYLGQTEHIKFHELTWEPQLNQGGVYTQVQWDTDGFLRIKSANAQGLRLIVVADSVDEWSYANSNLAEANFFDDYLEGDFGFVTFPFSSGMRLVLYSSGQDVSEGDALGEKGMYWTPLLSQATPSIESLQAQVDSLAEIVDAMSTATTGCQGLNHWDYHDYSYELVEVGHQCWFKENLRTSQFSNGDSIPSAWDENNSTVPWGMEACDTQIGWVYNGPARTDERNLCPSGWHVPTPLDFSQLASNAVNQSLMIPSICGIDLMKVNDWYTTLPENENCVEVTLHPNLGRLGCSYNIPPPGVTPQGVMVIMDAGGVYDWGETNPNAGTVVRCLKD